MWSWLSSTIFYFYTKSSTRKPPLCSSLPPGPGLPTQPLAPVSPMYILSSWGQDWEKCPHLVWLPQKRKQGLWCDPQHKARHALLAQRHSLRQGWMRVSLWTVHLEQTMSTVNNNAHKGPMCPSVAMAVARTMSSGWLENRHRWRIWNLGVVQRANKHWAS